MLLPTLLSSTAYLTYPATIWGWTGFLGLALLTGFLAWRLRGELRPWGQRERIIFSILILSIPLTGLVVGLRLNNLGELPPPGIPVDPLGPPVMIFSALPFVLAGGMLGPLAAALIGLLSGLVHALWGAHHIFTPIEWALVAVLFSAAVNQPYRTRFFKLLRNPLAAALLLILVYPLIPLVTVSLMSQGSLITRLDYALTQVGSLTLAAAIPILFAGVFAQVLMISAPKTWGSGRAEQPSPAESSLQARFLYNMLPLMVLLLGVLVIGDWIIAGKAARDMLAARLGDTARVAAEFIPYFLETGQNLITEMAADPRLIEAAPEDLPQVLAENLRKTPYFHQLYLLDAQGSPLSGYPLSTYTGIGSPLDEQMGIRLALNGVPIQSYTVPPAENQNAAQISFVTAVLDEQEKVAGVLIGRTDLSINPYTQPILTSLERVAGADGTGMLIDESGLIIYHPDPALVMSAYDGPSSTEAQFYGDTAPDGTRRLVYYQPAQGRPWSVVIMTPAQHTQALALQIATPLIMVVALLALLSVLAIRLAVRGVTGSLESLASEASLISQGQLDHALPVAGNDEVGRLRRAFEQMRASLKARMDEQALLLQVSQGVASSLDMEQAVKPILEAALTTGVSSVRVVLTPAMVPELEENSNRPTIFSAGPARDMYSGLDDQMLALTRQQERITLANMTRPRLLNLSANAVRPDSLLAVALRYENQYFGVLWVTFDQPHTFSEEEVRFVSTLANQAALAAANSRLFLTAETGRQRLAAILASSPDPMLVTDQNDRLLLANPAAWQILQVGVEIEDGLPIEEAIPQKELVDLLRSELGSRQSAEITLSNGQVYLATASSVMAEGLQVGRVCVLRDVTHFKELDAMKSDFVSTVSHDLRSPLTTIRGYAKMLEMAGPLNEQQNGYIARIVSSVDSMGSLVTNLLDLNRIESGIHLQVEIIPVKETIEQVVHALLPQASQKKIQLTAVVASQTIPFLEADASMLRQGLHNLVENAIKYTRGGGQVVLRAQTRGTQMVFEVSDNGIGISPIDQPRLFERFYRGAQQGSKQVQGAGLGLTIVRSIAERHHGSVWMESQLGKGSTFILSIPIRQVEVASNP